MADGINFRLDGFDELERELKSLRDDVESERIIRSAVGAAASTVRKRARKNLANHERTGELRRTLRVSTRLDRARKRATATVRTTRDTFYGLFLEYGTVRQAPIRWLSRALRENPRELTEAMAVRIRKRIAKARAKKR